MRVPEPDRPSQVGSSMKECPDCHVTTNATSICRACGYYLLAPNSNIVAASLWRRFFAYLLDYWILPILTLVVGWLIWFYFTAKAGQSPGKFLLGIRVINGDGTAITAGKMWQREVVIKYIIYGFASFSIIASWLVVYAYIRAFWDEDKRTWHDNGLRTLVVTSKSQPMPFNRTIPH